MVRVILLIKFPVKFSTKMFQNDDNSLKEAFLCQTGVEMIQSVHQKDLSRDSQSDLGGVSRYR